ncbi:MAG: metalloregulator ArsR/SmtB family transcription factor [Usitatibacter sp.]
MVTKKPATDAFRAMGDPTRREILRALLHGPAPVKRIAGQFECSRPAISKHLKVLLDARLVRQERSGREVVYHLEPEALAELRAWLDAFWSRGLARIKKSAEGRKK